MLNNILYFLFITYKVYVTQSKIKLKKNLCFNKKTTITATKHLTVINVKH